MAMDEFESGLITGAVLTALIFGIVYLQIWLDERAQARANARWVRDHADLQDCAPQLPQTRFALRAAPEQGAEALAGRDRNGARRTN